MTAHIIPSITIRSLVAPTSRKVLTPACPLVSLIGTCQASMREIDFTARAIRDDPTSFWEDLKFGVEADLLEVGVKATASGKNIVAALDKLGDGFDGEYGPKTLEITNLRKVLKDEMKSSKEKIDDLEKSLSQIRDDYERLAKQSRERVRKLEDHIGIARREMGSARWRELTGEGE